MKRWIALFSLFAISASAQETHRTYEPPNAPGAGQKLLAQFAGEWELVQSDGTFDGKNIVLWATALDPDRPGRKTVARAHLEDNGRVLLHRHFLIDDKGGERMMIELRLTRKSQ